MPDLTKQERAGRANSLLACIATRGRRFFWNETRNEMAAFHLRRGHIYFTDHYRGEVIYTHYRGRWRHFSGGGTLRSLVQGLRDYIRTGEPMDRHLGPWQQWVCDGDPWGYGTDAMQEIRDEAQRLGVWQPDAPTP